MNRQNNDDEPPGLVVTETNVNLSEQARTQTPEPDPAATETGTGGTETLLRDGGGMPIKGSWQPMDGGGVCFEEEIEPDMNSQ